jgi:Coenzyme PQQ synthesis protein D (PqqD)
MTAATTLSLSTTIRASDDQISCDVADEVVLLSMQTGQYYGLNQVGAAIWRLIQHPRTLIEVRDDLLAEYEGVSAETCAAEVVAFAANMNALGLVQLS